MTHVSENPGNEAPEGRTWRHHGSKMAPWRPLGGPWAPTLIPEGPGGALAHSGAARGSPPKSLLAAWGPPGVKSWSMSPPGGPPEGAAEGFGEALGGYFGGI